MVEILRLKATCKVTAVVKSILRIMATHPKTKQKSYYEKKKTNNQRREAKRALVSVET